VQNRVLFKLDHLCICKLLLIDISYKSFSESEEKKNLTWLDDGATVWYRNYRRWTFDRQRSCANCEYDSLVTVPNAAMIV
jgi:hypothetical protein